MTSKKIAIYRPKSSLLLTVFALLILLSGTSISAQTLNIEVISDHSGQRLQVDGQDFMVFGMNWGYMPIGQNYTYDFWGKPDDFIKTALEIEMSLLQDMGVNAIRQYIGIPPRWVEYIYENYGIWTILNHPIGRYGLTIDGVWVPATDYSDPKVISQIRGEIEQLAIQFRDTPGLLMWLLGNENNYGLHWSSFEIEALPEDERWSAKARYLYRLFGTVIDDLHRLDPNHPVSMANGDVGYIDIIAEECQGLDIMGTNVYRGISVRDLYEVVDEKLGIPVMFTEFGCDAFNARTMQEDQYNQARFLLGQWQEIYEQSAGKGRVGNAIGGITFQWSDGWWKYQQDANLSIHDTNASWPNGGYPYDYVEGENNMNEEWWGICAKGFTDAQGYYNVFPRAAYYALQDACALDPYASGTDLDRIGAHFASVELMTTMLQARSDKAALQAEASQLISLSELSMRLETISTGGSRVSTPDVAQQGAGVYPAFKGFDHMQTYFAEIEAHPAENVSGTLTLNYLGHVPTNPIDEIFYENRGRSRVVVTDNGSVTMNDIERLRVHNASVNWDDRWFQLNGFYRSGHYHWSYEGDFFGFYREANYGPNIDIYGGEAPLGVEVTFKKQMSGLKVAYGPELWWGANPALLVKYQRTMGSFGLAAVHQEDLEEQTSTVTSSAIPLPPIRRTSLHMTTDYGPFGIELGGIWAGSNKVGETFYYVKEDRALQDDIKDTDAFGGRAKLTFTHGGWMWYGQGAYQGLVADGGPDQTQTFTGWRLKYTGSGNQMSVHSGLAYNRGNWQFAPNFMWQKPLIGPIPSDAPAPAAPRNVLNDPFAVLGSREVTAAEFLITYDPTPATWMYSWDSDMRENARLAASIGLVYYHLPTTRDANLGFMEWGGALHLDSFGGAPPARDHWEARTRIVSKLRPTLGLIANFYGGTGEPSGDDTRLIHRYGGDIRLIANSVKLVLGAKLNDWGPYDYHRDFNLTYPLQLGADLSRTLGPARWWDLPQTRIGVSYHWRSLDQYSPRYCPMMMPDPSGGQTCYPDYPDGEDGNEWEIRTYLQLSLGKRTS